MLLRVLRLVVALVVAVVALVLAPGRELSLAARDRVRG